MLFDKFDENKDGFLSKSEMSILIKKTFAPPKDQRAVKK